MSNDSLDGLINEHHYDAHQGNEQDRRRRSDVGEEEVVHLQGCSIEKRWFQIGISYLDVTRLPSEISNPKSLDP